MEVAGPRQLGPFVRNEARLGQLGITPRELEILEALAAGLSTREIAERLFVSENTVKTHAARLFAKLSAQRRTQAVQRAKEAGLIPERVVSGFSRENRPFGRRGDGGGAARLTAVHPSASTLPEDSIP